MAVSEAQKRANEKYRKENVRQVAVRFYPPDHDLYDFVKTKSSMGEYIKALIRADMERSGE